MPFPTLVSALSGGYRQALALVARLFIVKSRFSQKTTSESVLVGQRKVAPMGFCSACVPSVDEKAHSINSAFFAFFTFPA